MRFQIDRAAGAKIDIVGTNEADREVKRVLGADLLAQINGNGPLVAEYRIKRLNNDRKSQSDERDKRPTYSLKHFCLDANELRFDDEF